MESRKVADEKRDAKRNSPRRAQRLRPRKIREPHYRCLGCGYPIPYQDSYCGECLCEDDDV